MAGRPNGPRQYHDEYPETRTQSFSLNSNAYGFTSSECKKCLNEKYLQHYYAKGCKPVEAEENQCGEFCPKLFDCPKPINQPTNSSGILYFH